jgi:leucyl-tRNA---protein transferase
MKTVVRWTAPPFPCDYVPDHICQREYLHVARMNRDEYMAYLLAGWRRFGHMLFRLNCSGSNACRSLRVDAACFRLDRSQRRARKANEGAIRLSIGDPKVSPKKVALIDQFHSERSETRGWSLSAPGDREEFVRRFVLNPFPTQEWCYFLDDLLIGVGYVDELAGGLSAIYFARDPTQRDRSLGTWNALCLIDRARALGLPHVYLGYHVVGCPSLEYKGRFRPNQSLDPDGVWRDSGK